MKLKNNKISWQEEVGWERKSSLKKKLSNISKKWRQLRLKININKNIKININMNKDKNKKQRWRYI